MKGNKKYNIQYFIVSIIVFLIVISLPSFKVNAEDNVDNFVERCYSVTLGRESDEEGFAFWKGKLLNGEAVGNELAYGFIFSPEYTQLDKSNEDYVTDLYMLFLGREPDEDGFNYWIGQLEDGKSKMDIFVGFANSPEFFNLCDGYGITAGHYITGYDRNQLNNVNLFVERLYKTTLGRIGDKDGQKNWVEKLLAGQITGVECARCFIQSKEYVNKNLTDDEYVENLYLAMMGRPSDETGKKNWLYALSVGKTRDEVFAGFANSEEFGNICNAYGIEKGLYTVASEDNLTYEIVLDKEMLDLINAYRAENGIDTLKWNTEAEQIAKYRIEAIAKGGVLSHNAAGGPPEGYVGENLFKGSGGYSTQFIFDGYKSSPGHDTNMRNAGAKSCVIATCNVYKSIGGLKANWGEWNIQIFY